MQELFSLGEIYISDFLKSNEQPKAKSELKLLMEDSGSVRLESSVDKGLMYGKYWYRSGINDSMKSDLRDIVESIFRVKKMKSEDLWLDIACNDGTMLNFVKQKNADILTLGIDPADDSYRRESEKIADEIVQDYFSEKAFRNAKITNRGKKKADVVTTIAMFYDLEDPASFIQDVRKSMHDNGLWVVQMSYTPLMIRQLAFDNICHEHVYYYSLFDIKSLFEKNGFKIVDCQLNSVNGGSFRIFAIPNEADETSFADQCYRDVAKFRIESTLLLENQMKMGEKETWNNFFEMIENLKKKTLDFIKTAKSEGKTVWAYGASTKGNTLLQYFELNDSLIDGIAERSHYKYGLRTVGTNIPIYSEEQMRKVHPDYLLVLPWHFISEFVDREADYLEKGGKFIVPCPQFAIIGK